MWTIAWGIVLGAFLLWMVIGMVGWIKGMILWNSLTNQEKDLVAGITPRSDEAYEKERIHRKEAMNKPLSISAQNSIVIIGMIVLLLLYYFVKAWIS